MATSTKIGRIEVLAMADFVPPPFPPQELFPDVPPEAWEPHRAHHALDEDGMFRTNFCFWVLRSDDFTVIVDTGSGPDNGKMPELLASAGVRHEDVTAVILTHLHDDHTGWTLTDGELTFPNAGYVISQVDWDYWTQASVAGSAQIEARVIPLQEKGVLTLSEDLHQVVPGISTFSTPGHTPGHQSILVDSDGEKGVMMGDVIHSRAQIAEPDWCAGFDADKPAAVATRKALIDRAVREKLTLTAGHLLMDTNIGQVVEVEGKRYWKAL